MAFDRQPGELVGKLADDELLLITSDHGNDQSSVGTDHTREYVPLIAYSPSLPGGGDLGIRSPFADLGATVLANFGVADGGVGQSFLPLLR